MKTKCCVILTCALFIGNVRGADGIPLLEKRFPVFSVTPTNLTVTFQPYHGRLIIKHKKGVPGRLSEYGEELVLTLDQETILTDGRHGIFVFTPVSYKNKQKGFQISKIIHYPSLGTKITLAYTALGNTLTRMREEDVLGEIPLPPPQLKPEPKPPPEPELKRRLRASLAEAEAIALANPGLAESKGIVVPPERGQFSRQDRAVTPPSREDNEEERLGETPSPCRLWLYTLIPLCLLPALYFLRRKFKTKN